MVDINRKIDLPLRKIIDEFIVEGNDENIDIVGTCSKPISSKIISDLELSGIQLYNVIYNIFEATGKAKSLKKIIAFDYIVNLELPKEQHEDRQ